MHQKEMGDPVGGEFINPEKNDRKVLLKIISEVLESFYGQATTELIYNEFERRYNTGREDIVDKPEHFSEFLRSISASEAQAIENLILEEVSRRLNVEIKRGEETFAETIRRISKQEL